MDILFLSLRLSNILPCDNVHLIIIKINAKLKMHYIINLLFLQSSSLIKKTAKTYKVITNNNHTGYFNFYYLDFHKYFAHETFALSRASRSGYLKLTLPNISTRICREALNNSLRLSRSIVS